MSSFVLFVSLCLWLVLVHMNWYACRKLHAGKSSLATTTTHPLHSHAPPLFLYTLHRDSLFVAYIHIFVSCSAFVELRIRCIYRQRACEISRGIGIGIEGIGDRDMGLGIYSGNGNAAEEQIRISKMPIFSHLSLFSAKSHK